MHQAFLFDSCYSGLISLNVDAEEIARQDGLEAQADDENPVKERRAQ